MCTGSGVGVSGTVSLPGRGLLTCTEIIPWGTPTGSNFPRPWNYNDTLLSSGKLIVTDPYQIPPGFNDGVNHDQVAYYLGAKLNRFAPEGNKYMIVENERSADSYAGSSTNGVAVGTDPAFPAWAGPGGRLAFRHNGRKIANFLFIDGHCESMKATDDCNAAARYSVTY